MAISVKQATEQDTKFLAQMILKSSRAGKKVGLFDFLFEMGSDAEVLEKIEKLTTTTSKSHCHYKNFLIAQIDGKNVGTLCSYEPRISNQETFIKALEEIGCCEDANDILAPFYECSFNIRNSTLMFDFMEELDDFVDVGVLKALMQKSLLNARLRGYRRAQTIIEIGSLETEMFYKKLGFRLVEQKECEEYRETFGRNGIMLFEIEF
ncbi:acyl-CoA acyltransferase [Sulfurimonas sp. C5]|uniref:acyl-CoA acyltransferase n=1 Tax=Sulfurimonas sp. C5 TaxID=3036947 RepID=UPI0024554284|nr:acyl-CoA acyltransferase [Sulfurimonas sp. C5]MDH4945258.1 acyl-CoA acyltransferase [Sulfurimonas sp. C5]